MKEPQYFDDEPSILDTIRTIGGRALVVGGALALTLAFFLVLPLMQVISERPEDMFAAREVSIGSFDPPPEVEEPEPEEEEPEPEPEEPDLSQDQQLLDLSQMELAMDMGGVFGSMTGDYTVNLGIDQAVADSAGDLFDDAGLEQPPRAVYRPSPVMTKRMRERAPGTVTLIFQVDPNGRVQRPQVEATTDPIFNRAALAAIKQWRFEPGKRRGKIATIPMRQSFTFPKR